MSMYATAFGVMESSTAAATVEPEITWPEVGIMFVIVLVIGGVLSAVLAFYKIRKASQQEAMLRVLVQRHEQLAASTMDAQQRTAADVAELRSRTASIEQILRTVE
ncbi:MAG: hypothetical protein QOG52_1041 [Frankiaceae bacterium]|jgi:Tfp pilus assembly protein PilO|nr:hypothetical protein [Frankiaceae bacterium]